MFNLAGAAAYCLVMALAIWAIPAAIPGGGSSIRPAGRHGSATVRRGNVRYGDGRHWLAVALLFAGLAMWRLTGGEQWVQSLARGMAKAGGAYTDRRAWQAPIVAGAILCGAALLFHFGKARNRPPAIYWSRLASLALLGFSLLRVLSFHPVDVAIYAGLGPFHVNHLIELVLVGTVGASAVAFRRSLRTQYNYL